MAIINPHYNQMFGQSAEYDGLKFTAVEAGSTIGFTVTGTVAAARFVQTSTDGVSWTFWDGTPITLSNVGGYIYVKQGKYSLFSTSTENYVTFTGSGKIAASGDVTSLTNNRSLANYVFYKLFYNASWLTSAPELPNKSLKEYCYYSMFSGATSLEKAPNLPATSLKTGCYNFMFKGCSNLKKISMAYTGNFDVNYSSTWVMGVSSSGGEFAYNGTDTTSRGISKIPSGWTVVSYPPSW